TEGDWGGPDADLGGDVEPDSVDASGTESCPPRSSLKTLAADRWGYELIPNVVTDDGSDSLVLEVFVTQANVKQVRLAAISFLFKGPGTGATAELRDDGQHPDRIAGDGIYTGGPYSYDPNSPVKIVRLYNDPESPAGLDFQSLGRIELVLEDDSVQQFLQEPVVGVLRADVPLPTIDDLGDGIAATSHVLNICGSDFLTQTRLRFLSGAASGLTQRAYGKLKDSAQFVAMLSTYKLERIGNQPSNYNAGLYDRVRNSISGINVPPIDSGALFGSDQHLLGVLTLDLARRGLNASNLAHELLHNWSGSVATGGISDGVHFSQHSSVGSLLGGFLWVEQNDGSFIRDCSEGRNKAHRAAPLDRYLMGLIPGDEVPPILIATTEAIVDCGGVEPPKPYSVVTIEEIQQQYGVRTPGPDQSRRDYRIIFLAESLGRYLTPQEMAFYTILAKKVAETVPLGDPDPYVQQLGWVALERFFGHGTSWETALDFK
ncbi:MAG: hypothetical protein KC609_12520, partial [Myxococcales bacterium]|nr:hypothetical protein [Myxococcales bacterium]